MAHPIMLIPTQVLARLNRLKPLDCIMKRLACHRARPLTNRLEALVIDCIAEVKATVRQ